MQSKLFIGNLSWEVTAEDLKALFAGAGAVVDAAVISDKMTGRSRGFGFITMSSDDEAKKAIEMFNGKDIEGRALVVNEARPREERPRQ